jgi:PiT family inorganic phosphate transporter
MDIGTVVIITVVLALAFDIVNGFHDAANSIATVVATRVLSPRVAVLWAAFFNFVALFIFHGAVADTISKIILFKPEDPAELKVWVVLCGLIGAIFWNLLTWWWGLPSSSSHALIGGVGGAGLAYAYFDRASGNTFDIINTAKLFPVLKFILIAPLIGLVLGFLIQIGVYWICRRFRPQKVDKFFRVGQLVSSAAYSVGHGGNDAQKTMGIIIMVLMASGSMHGFNSKVDDPPLWIVLSSYGCMAFGTAFGGWRIVKTMGMGLVKLRPIGGFCAEIAGAATLFGATHAAIPVSTTHTITGSIIGVGSATKARGIRWGLASRIVWAWVFTIPAAALVGAGCFAIVNAIKPW